MAELLTEWGVVDEACAGIKAATAQPKVDTVGVRSFCDLHEMWRADACVSRRRRS